MVVLVQNNNFKVSYIVVVIIVGLLCFSLGFANYSTLSPMEVYKVYIDGKLIGTVASKEEFDDYINEKDAQIKEKYGVDKVYVPNGVVVKKVVTYDKSIDSNEEVYNEIIKLKQFTIKGTIITIKKSDQELVTDTVSDELFEIGGSSLEEEIVDDDTSDDIVVFVINKDIFDEAVVKLIKSFVDEDGYNKYMKSEQAEIVDTGSVINSVDIYEEVTYKTGYISIDEYIFTNTDDLARYLLYGTLEEQDSYVVKEGDTIESVAEANKLNTQEFLLANPSFRSENTLLYEGQVVNVGLINPIISIVVEINRVLDEERDFDVKVTYDENELQNVEYVSQEGENGLYRVNREYQYINGQLAASQTLGAMELKPTVDKIIVKGKKEVPHIADLSYWAWPTENPYTITTYFGYRWGSMHAAIDISGPGWGSAIYAANNGTVIEAKSGCAVGYVSCNGKRGNYIVINHNNGNYYTEYMHMANIYVSVGDTVSRGQKIGTMGNTGEVYPVASSSCIYCGTHLHFAVYIGKPYAGGYKINPLNLY